MTTVTKPVVNSSSVKIAGALRAADMTLTLVYKNGRYLAKLKKNGASRGVYTSFNAAGVIRDAIADLNARYLSNEGVVEHVLH